MKKYDFILFPIITFGIGFIVSIIFPEYFSFNNETIVTLSICTICYWLKLIFSKWHKK